MPEIRRAELHGKTTLCVRNGSAHAAGESEGLTYVLCVVCFKNLQGGEGINCGGFGISTSLQIVPTANPKPEPGKKQSAGEGSGPTAEKPSGAADCGESLRESARRTVAAESSTIKAPFTRLYSPCQCPMQLHTKTKNIKKKIPHVVSPSP